MKPVFSLLLLLSLLLSLAACSDASAPTPPQTAPEQAAQTAPALRKRLRSLLLRGFDIDLTALSRTMVYSEVYNMMMTPENYIGKVVRMNGLCSTFESVAVDGQEARVYYTCIIFDATACCSPGHRVRPGRRSRGGSLSSGGHRDHRHRDLPDLRRKRHFVLPSGGRNPGIRPFRQKTRLFQKIRRNALTFYLFGVKV